MSVWEGVIEVGPHVFRPLVGAADPQVPDAIPVFKTLPMMRRLADHIEAEKPLHIVEVGVQHGGSTALLAALAPRARILALELMPGPAIHLQRYARAGGDVAGVRAEFGVDQADADRLRALVAETFAGAPPDLVIDDASHELIPSRATLDALFPLLRPNGCYVLEDWSWSHLRAAQGDRELAHLSWPPGPSLGNLVYELVMATVADGLVSRVEIDFSMAWAWRGPREVDPARFRVRDYLSGVEPYPEVDSRSGPPAGSTSGPG